MSKIPRMATRGVLCRRFQNIFFKTFARKLERKQRDQNASETEESILPREHVLVQVLELDRDQDADACDPVGPSAADQEPLGQLPAENEPEQEDRRGRERHRRDDVDVWWTRHDGQEYGLDG